MSIRLGLLFIIYTQALFCARTPVPAPRRQLVTEVIGNSNSTAEHEAAARVGSRLLAESERGHLVALFCRVKCLKLRSEVGKWVREVNVENKRHVESQDRVRFHFHALRRPIGLFDIDNSTQKVMIFYIVTGQGFQYTGNVMNKSEFQSWVRSFNRISVYRPLDHIELDGLLNSTESCYGATKFALLVHDPEYCPEESVMNIARSFTRRHDIHVAELRRPLTDEMETVLMERLKGLKEKCKSVIYLYRGRFLEMNQHITPSLLHTSLAEWQVECNSTKTGRLIGPGITEIQLEYWKDERSATKLRDNHIFVVVGAIGGIAVIALAISIFWGLQSA